jgi:hypothetical protein
MPMPVAPGYALVEARAYPSGRVVPASSRNCTGIAAHWQGVAEAPA